MRPTARSGTRIAIAAIAATAILLPGCGSVQGKKTSEQRSAARQRMDQMKSATEWDLARQAYLAGDLEKALEKVDNSIALNGEVPKSHVLRGRILLEQGALGEAIDSFETAEALDPQNVDTQYFQGIVYERLIRREQALTHYQKAAELDQSNAQYPIAVAEVLVDLDRIAEADAYLAGLGQNFENSAGIRQTRGHLAKMLGRDQQAVEFFRTAHLLAPDDTAIVEDLTRAQIAVGDFAEAEYNIATLREDERFMERRDLQFIHAQCLLQLDRPMEAREILLELTNGSAGATDPEAWSLLGQVAYRLRDMNRVRRAGSRLQAMAPERYEGYLFQALWQRHAGRHAAAVRSTSEALKRKENDFASLTLRGMALADMGKLEAAEKTFEYTLRVYPNNKTIAQALAGVRNKIENGAVAAVEEPND